MLTPWSKPRSLTVSVLVSLVETIMFLVSHYKKEFTVQIIAQSSVSFDINNSNAMIFPVVRIAEPQYLPIY